MSESATGATVERAGPWTITRSKVAPEEGGWVRPGWIPPEVQPGAVLPPGFTIRAPSKSSPGKFYTLTIGPKGGVKCDKSKCPGSRYRGDCSHAKDVRLALGRPR